MFVSHRLDEVVEIAERVTVLRDGRKVGTYPPAEVDSRRLAELMTGPAVEQKPITARDDCAATPLLEVTRADAEPANTPTSVSSSGEARCSASPGCSGRDGPKLALSLFGMTRPDAGEIRVGGRRRSRCGRTRTPSAPGSPTCRRTASISASTCASRSRTTSSSRCSPGSPTGSAGSSSAGGATPAAEWVSRLRIRAAGVDDPVQQLSGGNQQRVVLAKWLATDPQALILDSPTVGVDIGNKRGHLRDHSRACRPRHRHPAHLGRDSGSLLRTATACCTCAADASLASTAPARSASTSSRSGSMPDLLRRFSGHTEVYLAIVIAIDRCRPQRSVALLPDALQFHRPDRDLFGHRDPRAWACSWCWFPAGSTSPSRRRLRSRNTDGLVGTDLGWPAYVCIPLGLAIGSLLGCVNAALIHYLRITSIIITIATMSAYFALLMYFSGGKSIYNLPDWWSTRVVFYQTETRRRRHWSGSPCRSSSCSARSCSPMS